MPALSSSEEYIIRIYLMKATERVNRHFRGEKKSV